MCPCLPGGGCRHPEAPGSGRGRSRADTGAGRPPARSHLSFPSPGRGEQEKEGRGGPDTGQALEMAGTGNTLASWAQPAFVMLGSAVARTDGPLSWSFCRGGQPQDRQLGPEGRTLKGVPLGSAEETANPDRRSDILPDLEMRSGDKWSSAEAPRTDEEFEFHLPPGDEGGGCQCPQTVPVFLPAIR